MTAYYNENDPHAAAWLRNLVAGGHIAPGVVDERSIEDIAPDELAGFTQCHFFAGIGVWSYALRLAGVPDDFAVWTGSCPCQPFSSAGEGAGFADERHLWPAWFHLIEQCRPAVVCGEQVASRDGLAWLDLVHADLEGAGYAVGAADLCAAGVGAPHIRQRLFFVAHADGRHAGAEGLQRRGEHGQQSENGCARVWLAHADQHGRQGGALHVQPGQPRRACVDADRDSATGAMAHAQRPRLQARSAADLFGTLWDDEGRQPGQPLLGGGPWSEVEWIACRDGKARPTQPGLFPLAHGVAGRVGKLRAYGNAICAPVAAAFVRAAL